MLTNNNDDWKNRPRKNRLTAEEHQLILQQHEEAAKDRQAAADRALLAAVELARKLKQQKGE